MQLMKREYNCGICMATEMVETNHENEIYSSCKFCGNTFRYCVSAPKSEPEYLATLNSYVFNLMIAKDQEAYIELCSKLEKEGAVIHYDMFNWNTQYPKNSLKWRKIAENLNGKSIS